MGQKSSVNHMDKLIIVVLIAFTCTGYGIASDTSEWPFMAFKKGDTAALPCLPQGDANAYFWRKGKWFNVSENVASIVHGIPDNSGKYEVLPNGSLLIRNMSSDDEGTYYCRIASDVNECHGHVNVYLQVTAVQLEMSIKECNWKPTCNIYLEPLAQITLTCSANLVSDAMTLKWYDGPEEIIGEIVSPNEPGKKLKSIIRLTVTTSAYLSCEAFGIAVSRSIAYVGLHVEGDNEIAIPKSSNIRIWIVLVVVLSALCLILVLVLVITIYRFRKTSGKAEINSGNEEQGLDEVTESLIQTKFTIACCLDPSSQAENFKKFEGLVDYVDILRTFRENHNDDSSGTVSNFFENVLQGGNSCVFICGCIPAVQGNGEDVNKAVEQLFEYLLELQISECQVSITDITKKETGDYYFEDAEKSCSQTSTMVLSNGNQITRKIFTITNSKDLIEITSKTIPRSFDDTHYTLVNYYVDNGVLSCAFIDDVFRVQRGLEGEKSDPFDEFLTRATQTKTSIIGLVVYCNSDDSSSSYPDIKAIIQSFYNVHDKADAK